MVVITLAFFKLESLVTLFSLTDINLFLILKLTMILEKKMLVKILRFELLLREWSFVHYAENCGFKTHTHGPILCMIHKFIVCVFLVGQVRLTIHLHLYSLIKNNIWKENICFTLYKSEWLLKRSKFKYVKHSEVTMKPLIRNQRSDTCDLIK